jgi:hypothetical protein
MNKFEHISKKLSPARLKAIAALLENETIAAAAKTAKIGRTTLYEWLKDPEFAAALNEGREMIFIEALDALKTAAKMATDRLIQIMGSDDIGQARLAAVAILRYSIEGHEIKEIDARISRIEKIIENRNSYVS